MTLTIENDHDTWIGTVTGRLDTVNAITFEKEMQPLLEHADKEIVLDCKDLEYISSSGLRQFLVLRKMAVEKGGSVVIMHINNELRQVFTITGLFNLFEFRS